MSDGESTRSKWPRFSLFHLLGLTTLVALGVAMTLANRKHRALVQYRDDLLLFSSQPKELDKDKLVSSSMPHLADDFESWYVNVPTGNEFELRLGIGKVSEVGVPPVVGSVPIPAGQHRITLHAADSPREAFTFVVYLDGQPVIQKAMGSDWLPGGWSSSSGLNWGRKQTFDIPNLWLSGRSYQPKRDFGASNYFNGNSDNYITTDGYRLWIDARDHQWEPASPFIGFSDDDRFVGTGLRDGLRYKLEGTRIYPWTFTQPVLQAYQPIWKITPEFHFDDGSSLTEQTSTFQSWLMRDDASGENPLNWQFDSKRTVYSAFLHAKHQSDDLRKPVVELKWDADRPDEVGIRLADTPANDRIKSWRLCLEGASQHLWREINVGNRLLKASELVEVRENQPVNSTVDLDVADGATQNKLIQWQTDELLPLQIVQRKQSIYSGLKLYDGLPVTFHAQIPKSLEATCKVSILAEHPDLSGQPFPGGPVFDGLQLELDSSSHDWIWLSSKPK